MNGCGPDKFGWLVPEGPKGLFHEPCNLHDDRYKQGGTERDRIQADWIMFKDCLAAVKHERWPTRYKGYFWAVIYFAAVLIVGWLRFNYKVMR
jgi:hypothetical protein